MKTPQKPAAEKKVAAPVPAPVEEEAFTARELEAAVQLIHLSESSASSGSTRAAGAGRAAYPAAGSSSSPRSVNAPPPVVFLAGFEDWEEEEENEVAGSQRRVKRYRLIAEIYDKTEEIGGRSSGKNKKKKE